MDDQRLVKMAIRLDKLKKLRGEIEKRIALKEKKITEELERRDVTAIESAGYRIKLSRRESPQYDMRAAKQVLKDVFNEVTELKINPKALEAAVGEGKVTLQDLRKFVTISYSKPWTTVSPLKDG